MTVLAADCKGDLGPRRVLIDADTGSNGLTRLSGKTGTAGVAEVVRGDSTLAAAVVDLNDGNDFISLLPSQESASSANVQQSKNEMAFDEMRKLLQTAQAGYDVTIVDLGRLTAGRQSAIGAALAERTVLVAPCGSLRKDLSTAQGLLNRLASSGHLLVLNRADSLDPAFSLPGVAAGPIPGASRKRLKNFSISKHGV